MSAAPHQDLMPTLKANWGVFIPTQAINFSVVPPAYRLLTINLVNMCVPFARLKALLALLTLFGCPARLSQPLEHLPLDPGQQKVGGL